MGLPVGLYWRGLYWRGLYEKGLYQRGLYRRGLYEWVFYERGLHGGEIYFMVLISTFLPSSEAENGPTSFVIFSPSTFDFPQKAMLSKFSGNEIYLNVFNNL